MQAKPHAIRVPYFKTMDYPDYAPCVQCKECRATHAIVGEKKAAGLPTQNFIVHCPKTNRPRRYTPAEAIWGIPLGTVQNLHW